MNSRNKLIDYMRIKSPDKEALADLVTRAKGPNRSLRQFADELGVNVSTLSRIVNMKTARSNSDNLIADIADHADPNSNVTFEMLMEAHGMSLKSNVTGRSMSMYSDAATTTIIRELARRDYTINGAIHESVALRRRPTTLDSIMGRCILDLELHTNALGKEDSVWLFDFRGPSKNTIPTPQYLDRIRQWMLMYAGMLCFNEGKVDRLSVVISEKEVYDQLLTYLKGYKTRYGMSVILIDLERGLVIDEYVLNDDPTGNPVFFSIEEEDFVGTEINDFENAVVFGDEFICEIRDIAKVEEDSE